MQNGAKRLFPVLLAGMLMMVESSLALAQSPTVGPPALRRSRRPAVSPYLNLAAAGGNPDAVAFQYYNRVLPDAQFRKAASRGIAAIDKIDAEIAEQRRMLQQSKTSSLSTTGHTTRFQDLGSYYNTNNRGR